MGDTFIVSTANSIIITPLGYAQKSIVFSSYKKRGVIPRIALSAVILMG
jgi:hypothetical protein